MIFEFGFLALAPPHFLFILVSPQELIPLGAAAHRLVN
jgi:hypothetical protein